MGGRSRKGMCTFYVSCNVRFSTDSHVLYIDKIVHLENVDTIKIEILHIQRPSYINYIAKNVQVCM